MSERGWQNAMAVCWLFCWNTNRTEKETALWLSERDIFAAPKQMHIFQCHSPKTMLEGRIRKIKERKKRQKEVEEEEKRKRKHQPLSLCSCLCVCVLPALTLKLPSLTSPHIFVKCCIPHRAWPASPSSTSSSSFSLDYNHSSVSLLPFFGFVQRQRNLPGVTLSECQA